LALAASLVAVGCSDQGIEERARELQEKVQSSLQNRMAEALAQKATAEEIKQAQQALTHQKEYMGEINGKLDAVTVNAIQAFQRAKGLDDDGILDAETKELLAEASRG
jgi:peptidoglycan hydrolase-like protein with peptidoglycan-binding domain